MFCVIFASKDLSTPTVAAKHARMSLQTEQKSINIHGSAILCKGSIEICKIRMDISHGDSGFIVFGGDRQKDSEREGLCSSREVNLLQI